jgi:hypothetical protein
MTDEKIEPLTETWLAKRLREKADDPHFLKAKIELLESELSAERSARLKAEERATTAATRLMNYAETFKPFTVPVQKDPEWIYDELHDIARALSTDGEQTK